MATVAILDQNKDAAVATKVTASITLVSGREYRLAVSSTIGFPAPNAATCTGWTQVATRADNTHGSPMTITTLRRTGAGEVGTHTIAFGGQTQTELQYSIVEFTGTVTGAGSSVQTNSAVSESGTGDTLLDAGGLTATSAANVVWIAGIALVNGALTLKAGYTTAGSQVSTTTQFMAGYFVGADDAPYITKPDFTYGDAIAEEIAIAGATTTTSPYVQPVPMRPQPGGFQQSGGVLSLRFATSAPPSPPSSATVATNGPAAYIQPIPMRAGPPFGFPLAMPFAFAASPPQAQGASLAAPDGIGYLMKIPMRQGPGGFARGQAAIGGMNGSTSNPIPVTPSTAGTGSRIGRMLRTGKL